MLFLACLVSSGVATIPSDMRAVQATQFESPPFPHLNTTQRIAVPKPSLGQVLIKVNFSSVNPVDWKIIEPNSGFGALFRLPHTLGFDVAGQVVETGFGCSRLKVGDAVWADLGKFWVLKGAELGAYAEYAVADESQVGIKPSNLNDDLAAAIPLAGLTSYQALKKCGAPWEGQSNLTVLITSGSGGTGHLAVQMAKKVYGASTVISVTSTENMDYVQSIGADKVFDYTKEDVFQMLANNSVDIVYDNYGAPGTADKAMPIIKSGGCFIFLPGKGGSTSKVGKAGVKQVNFGLCDSSSYKDLDALKLMCEAGNLVPNVQQSFPLEHIHEAFTTSIGGKVVGKLGISVA